MENRILNLVYKISNGMRLTDFITLLGISNYDLAIPIEWQRKLLEVFPKADVRYYIWSYDNDMIFGEPVNIAEEFINKFGKIFPPEEIYELFEELHNKEA